VTTPSVGRLLVAFALCAAAAVSHHAAAQDLPETTRAAARSVRTLTPQVLLERVGRGGVYRLHRWSFSLDRVELDIERVPRSTSLATMLQRTHALLATNAGFFDEHNRPVGLVVAQGRTLTPFARSVAGGVLFVHGSKARVALSDGFALPIGTSFAVQAKPPLLDDGAIVQLRRGINRADRTALCVRENGKVLDVYIARSRHPRGRGGPSLRAFGRTLLAQGCEEALNLDGGSSTGVAWREPRGVRELPARTYIPRALIVRARGGGESRRARARSRAASR